jgi:hypothetical protein
VAYKVSVGPFPNVFKPVPKNGAFLTRNYKWRKSILTKPTASANVVQPGPEKTGKPINGGSARLKKGSGGKDGKGPFDLTRCPRSDDRGSTQANILLSV